MKVKPHLLTALVSCICTLTVVSLLPQHNASAGSGAKGASENGDVNGSGRIDISDAIYLLTYLFSSGPEPVAIECNSCCPQTGSLPATGQTKCYSGVEPYEEIDCASADFPGQDGFYQTGCPMEGRFVDNGDGTVTDNCTGLTWQQATADTNGDVGISDDDMITWPKALQYCENLEFVGYDDWRLPNVRELQSIVDCGRWGPAIDPVFSAESSWYWSSSTDAYGPVVAWGVHFRFGTVSIDNKSHDDYVRAVRG